MAPEPHPAPAVVAVTGSAGALGRRVVARLAADPAVSRVVSLDLVPPPPTGDDVSFTAVDLATGDLKPLLEGVDAVVHLAFAAERPELPAEAVGEANVEAARRVLDAAGAVGAGQLVLVSSATVYGAWPNNPVPLTEAAPVRPNPGFAYAVQKAELERLAHGFVETHAGTRLAVLRPAVAVGDDDTWLWRSLRAAAPVRAGDGDRAVQFVHLDDLAEAVVLAVRDRLDGVFNVAAEGWITAEDVRALDGAPPAVRLPERVVTAVADRMWRWRLGSTPPGLIPYTIHPWVVATDRLRAAGWAPQLTNEEAFVAASEGSPWSRLSPKRRQELALAATALPVLGLVAGVVALVRRRRRRR